MTEQNPHSAFIDKRIADVKKSNKWKTKLTDTSHEDFIYDFGSNVFTNFVRNTFTAAYLQKHMMAICMASPDEQQFLKANGFKG